MRPVPKFTLTLLISGLMIFGLNSCTQDYFKLDTLKEDPFTWEPDLAFPLVNSSMSASDILTNVDSTNIYLTEDDGFVTLIYRSVIFSQTINEYFSIPAELPFEDSESLNNTQISEFNGTGFTTSNYNNVHNFGLTVPGGSGALLDEIEFRSGTLSVTTSGNMGHEGSVIVTYPDLTLNGVPLSMTIDLDANQNGSGSEELVGYVLDLDNNGPHSIEAVYELEVVNSGGAAPSTLDEFTVLSTFENSTMQYASGDFGQFDIGITPNNVDIDILDSQQEGEITFHDPRLRIRIMNSIGANIGGTINDLSASDPDGGSTPVQYAAVTGGDNFIIPAAPVVGGVDSLVWYFTGPNNAEQGETSNIDDVINDNFEDLEYDLSGIVNPGTGPFSNWAEYNSAVEVIADVELPFWGTAENFTIRDTIDFPIAEAEDLSDNILEALLRVSTDNGFPVDGQLKLYFADSVYNVTDSVLADGEFLIRSGLIDGNGRVTTSTVENNDIVLDEDRIANVFGAKYIILDAIMNSTNNGQTAIKIYDDYELGVSLGFQVKLSASPSDLGGL